MDSWHDKTLSRNDVILCRNAKLLGLRVYTNNREIRHDEDWATMCSREEWLRTKSWFVWGRDRGEDQKFDGHVIALVSCILDWPPDLPQSRPVI